MGNAFSEVLLMCERNWEKNDFWLWFYILNFTSLLDGEKQYPQKCISTSLDSLGSKLSGHMSQSVSGVPTCVLLIYKIYKVIKSICPA